MPTRNELAWAIHCSKAYKGIGVPSGIGCGWAFASVVAGDALCPCPAEADKILALLKKPLLKDALR